MIRLDTVNRSLQIILSGAVTANQLTCAVCYSDDVPGTSYNGGTQLSLTNNTTAVTICAVPPAGTSRDIDFISVYNADTTPKTVVIRISDGGTFYTLVDVIMQVDDRLVYTHGSGWQVLSSAGGTVTSVFGRAGAVVAQAGDYSVLQVTGAVGKPSNVFTIGATNCDYTSIQTALNANPTANALFLIYPGTYTDTITLTASGQCIVGMGTARQQIIQQATANILNIGAFANCRAKNLTLTITAATSAVACVTGTTGTAEISECNLNCTNSTVTTASQPSLVNITGSGSITIEGGEHTYTNNVSDGTGVTAIKAAFLSGTGASVYVSFVDNITINGSGQALGTTLAYSSGTGNFIINRSYVVITDTGAAVVAGYYYAGSGVISEFGYNHISVIGGGANSVIGVFLNGTATLTSHFNHFFCSGGLTNYSFNIAAGNTLNTYFDAISAASGTTGAGTITFAPANQILATGWASPTGPIGSTAPVLIYETNTTGITAAGSTQGTATALTTQYNKVTTCPAGAGVILPTPANVGALAISVDNDTATTLNVYPQSGAQIDSLGTNNPLVVPPGGSIIVASASTTVWDTYGGLAKYTYLSSGIPFIYVSSGTMGNNGALSAITAISAIYPKSYVYLPANAISAGSAAGWYYAVFSSTTAATIYNNTYTTGQPLVPASPTAFVTTGPGAYTQTTATYIQGPNSSIPGNSVGVNGAIKTRVAESNNNSANTKLLSLMIGGSSYITPSFTTGTVAGFDFYVSMSGALANQVITAGGNAQPQLGTVNFATTQTVGIGFYLTTATDTISVISSQIEVSP